MGLLSPTAYDALLLEKVKLLLQAALQNPKRHGPPASYEHFVEALDVNDEGSLRVMEVLLYETTTRRPRKLPTSGSDPVASSSSSSGRRARDLPADDSFARTSRRSGQLITFSDSDSDSSDGLTMPIRSRLRPVGIRARGDDGASPSLQLRQQQIDELFGYTDPLPSFSQVLSDFSSSTPSASQSASTVTVSSHSASDLPTFEELWHILLDEPFPSGTVTSFASFLARLNASSFSPTPLVSTTMPALLRELARRDPAIPIRVRNAIIRRSNAPNGSGNGLGSGSGTSLPSFREFLQQNPSGDMNPHEVAELARLRRELLAQDGGSGGEGSNAAAAEEGIWHASFVEHLEDGSVRETPLEFGGESSGSAAAPALSFSEHARRRRAERRQREEEGANPPDSAASTSTAGAAMDVDSSTTGAATPSITITNASTPATSLAPSPPAGASGGSICPSPSTASSSSSTSASIPAPPRPPRTSASIAEDHFRRQRPIARLPSPASRSSSASGSGAGMGAGVYDALSGPSSVFEDVGPNAGGNQSLRAVVDALSRSRARRLMRDGTSSEGGLL
ncbi:hypothetical protein JCM6882_007317 [Rhodosporidiobolus microsporus]